MERGESSDVRPERPWWYRPEVAVIILVVFGVYFSRLTALPVCGEESRWASVAVEMRESGDWVVPRQQGQWFPDRPPLQNWMIGLVGFARGDVDKVAIRLPSAMAILLTSLLIYGYGRTFLSRFGAMSAALVFATCGQVLQLGNMGETESLFTLLVSASLLVWHWGYVASRPRSWTWIAGCSLAAAAALTKGLQGPIYFFATVGVFLLLRRDWRSLFAWQPLYGIAVFVGLVGAWQIPYYLATDWDSVRLIWTDLVQQRLTFSGLLAHMGSYPLETLACLLPWSPLLLQFVYPGFRASIGRARPQLAFLVTALLVTYPSVWLAAGAVTRYYMPMYPCVALLLGLIIQRSVESAPGSGTRVGWNLYLAGSAVALALGGVFVVVVSLVRFEKLANVGQTLPFAVLFALASAITAAILLQARVTEKALAGPAAVVALAGFVGLAYTGIVVNSQVAIGNDPAPMIAELREKLPNPDGLVSFGRVRHLFRYYYRLPIRALDLPETADRTPTGIEYFCIDTVLEAENPRLAGAGYPHCRAECPDLPFAWEVVAIVPCGRHRTDRMQDGVLVGRIVKAATRTAQTASNESKRR